MANTKSTQIENIETALRTFNDVRQAGAGLHVAFGTVEVAAADDDAHIYAMLRLPSQAVPYSALIMSDAIAGATDYDLGVFTPTEGSGDPVAVDADILADGVDINAGFAQPTELLGHTGGKPDPANLGKPLWELAGVAADPGDDTLYDICFVGNTVGTAAGTISLAVLYAILGQ
jgi:hypothetical protein